jgi:hypothetical protein|tara:strand:- start:1716 stop:2129 length:414 start_codon:yes stop_codon:yes gene_type:complete
MKINAFDIDGVIHLGAGVCGIRPGPSDLIITGRSWEEEQETLAFLRRNGIFNTVFFNPARFDQKSRESSGFHKGKTIAGLDSLGIEIEYFFEDDAVQKEAIEHHLSRCFVPLNTKVILVDNPHVKKENVRHLEDLDG